jgi:hypothetical protein
MEINPNNKEVFKYIILLIYGIMYLGALVLSKGSPNMTGIIAGGMFMGIIIAIGVSK